MANIQKIIELFKKNNLLYQTNILSNDNENIECVYFGIDPTAKSLHIGHIIFFIIAKKITELGVKVLILIGDITHQLGDPSFREMKRKESSYDNKNIDFIHNIIKRIVDNIELKNYEIVFNSTWLKNINIINYCNEFGKEVTLNDITESRIFSDRKNTYPISLSEVMYCTIQGIDFFHLFQKYNCFIQYGGQDQWFNMSIGQSIIRKKLKKKSYVITIPLISKDGKKISKTTNNSVLFDLSTDPILFWQYILLMSKDTLEQIQKIIDINIYEYLFKCIFSQECLKYIKYYTNLINQKIDITNEVKYLNMIPKINIEKIGINNLIRKVLNREIGSSQIDNILKNGITINNIIVYNKLSILQNIHKYKINIIKINNIYYIFIIE